MSTTGSQDAGPEGPLGISIGICAYNEEANIERCIRSIFSQDLEGIDLRQVLVVSSGSTDRTDEIVRSLMTEYEGITFLPQESRQGKNSAINLYLDNMTSGIAVMLNADNLFASDRSLRSLVEPFRDPGIGMVGGHPIPTNDPSTRIGFASQMLWAMHHNVAMIVPKIGELVAFRDIGTRLRTDLQSDEDIIRIMLERAGYRIVYAPDATIYNRGPETEEDFLKQRVRVNVGEITMRRIYDDFEVPSWDRRVLLKAYLRTMGQLGFHPFKMGYMTLLELKARRLAEEHVRRGEDNMSCWDPVGSTKRVRHRTVRPWSTVSPGPTTVPSARTEFETLAPLPTLQPSPSIEFEISAPSTSQPSITRTLSRSDDLTVDDPSTTESVSLLPRTVAPAPM